MKPLIKILIALTLSLNLTFAANYRLYELSSSIVELPYQLYSYGDLYYINSESEGYKFTVYYKKVPSVLYIGFNHDKRIAVTNKKIKVANYEAGYYEGGPGQIYDFSIEVPKLYNFSKNSSGSCSGVDICSSSLNYPEYLFDTPFGTEEYSYSCGNESPSFCSTPISETFYMSDTTYDYFYSCPASSPYYDLENGKCIACKEDEKFNPETGKCKPKCGEGKYFDPELNECIPKGAVDCDIDENGKYFPPPGFTMYEKEKSYICEPDNCIAAIEPKDKYQCLCKSQGLGSFRNVITFKDYLFNFIKNGKIVAKNINIDELAKKYDLHTAIHCDNGGLAFNDITLEPINLDMFDITKPEPKPSEPFKPEPKPNPKPDKPVSPNPDPVKPNPQPNPDKPSPNPTNPGNGSNTPNPNPSNGDISDNNNTTPGKNGGNNTSTETNKKGDKDGNSTNGSNGSSNANASSGVNLGTIEDLLRQIEKNTQKDGNGTDLSGIEGLLEDIKNGLSDLNSTFGGSIDDFLTSDDVTGFIDGISDNLDNFDFKADIEESLSYFDKFEKQLNDLKSLIDGKGIPKINTDGLSGSCPISRDFISPTINETITWDLCQILSPYRDTYYLLFYISFVLVYVIASFKLVIILFLGFKS